MSSDMTTDVTIPTGNREDEIQIYDLHKSFGDLEVLKGIDLVVHRGEVVCVIGPSGSGKSTLLRCVNLLEQPTKGRIFILNEEITDPDADVDHLRTLMGMVFQSFNLFPHLTALENCSIALTQVLKKPPPRRRRSPWRTCTRWVSETAPTPTPSRCPAASSSVWRSRGRCRWTPS
jgi:polar amino acid transport system ATP-binding protein